MLDAFVIHLIIVSTKERVGVWINVESVTTAFLPLICSMVDDDYYEADQSAIVRSLRGYAHFRSEYSFSDQ